MKKFLLMVNLTLSMALVFAIEATASTETLLHNFAGGRDGQGPIAGLIADAQGNLYGTTWNGGGSANCPAGCGTVFRLKPGLHGLWIETVLYSFVGGLDGANPVAGLVADSHGNLYGTTEYGGAGQGGVGVGTVFKLTPGGGGTYTESVLYAFKGNYHGVDVELPFGGLVLDAAGNLYGTGWNGGACFAGGVFKLAPSGGGWVESLIHNFHCTTADGANPLAGLVFDRAGNLYGTTGQGGAAMCSCGTVFELRPSPNGTWTEQVLHSFADGSDGATPIGGLVLDAAGNLYGTASAGTSYGGGVVFEVYRSGIGWSFETLYTFTRHEDGGNSLAGLVFDSHGNLYGTTPNGGVNGTVFELTPGSGGAWDYVMLWDFHSGGTDPQGGLTFGLGGNLYGTTYGGGPGDLGVVFSLTP